MKPRSNKKIYVLEDEILVEVKTIYKLKPRDLGISPETASEAHIKEKILKTLSEGGEEEIDALKPILSRLEILKSTALTRSVPKVEDEEEV